MDTYKIFNVEEKSLNFRGNLVSSVGSSRIATAHGDVWFELNAYDRENNEWVTTIAMKREDDPCDEVFDFYSTVLLSAAEDFLYDFDPLRILPKDVTLRGLAENQSLMTGADHSYFAAVRRLIREMKEHEQAKQEIQCRIKCQNPQSAPHRSGGGSTTG